MTKILTGDAVAALAEVIGKRPALVRLKASADFYRLPMTTQALVQETISEIDSVEERTLLHAERFNEVFNWLKKEVDGLRIDDQAGPALVTTKPAP